MAYRNSTSATGTSAIPAVAVPAGVAANDIIILAVEFDAAAVTIPQAKYPSGFTLLADVASGPDGGRVSYGWKRATGADTGSYTFATTGTSADWVCQAWAFSGRDTTNPPIATATNNTSANTSPVTATVPAVTAVAGDDLLTLCAPDVSVTGAFNVYTSRPSGYTPDQAAQKSFANLAGDHLNNASAGSTGTKTYVFSLTSGNSGWYAAHIRIPVLPAGGTTLNVTVSDSSTITENVDVIRNNARDITVSDSSAVTENVVSPLVGFTNVNDASTVTENVLRLLDANPSVSDASAVTENTVVRLEANVSVSDSSTVTENTVPFVTPLYVNVSDASAITENIVMLETAFVNVNDSSAITENVQRLETIAVTTSDTTGITENTQFNEVAFINVNDSSGITENALVQIPSGSDLNVTVSDSSAITENILRLQTAFIAVSDSSAVTDSVLRMLDANPNVSDASGITENIGRALIGNIVVSDSSTITESVSLLPNPLLVSVSDSSTITESRSVDAGGPVVVPTPGLIFLTDGRMAIKVATNMYLPL